MLEHLDGCIAWKDPAQALAQKERMRQKKEKEMAEAAERQAVAEGHTEKAVQVQTMIPAVQVIQKALLHRLRQQREWKFMSDASIKAQRKEGKIRFDASPEYRTEMVWHQRCCLATETCRAL